MSTTDHKCPTCGTNTTDDRLAHMARWLTINMLALVLGAIAFVVWRVNGIAESVHHLSGGQ